MLTWKALKDSHYIYMLRQSGVRIKLKIIHIKVHIMRNIFSLYKCQYSFFSWWIMRHAAMHQDINLTSTITWKYKDEESTDSPDNTDHFADVRNERCYEKSDCDPGCGQGNTRTALVRLRHRGVFVSLPQQWVLDHRSTRIDWSVPLYM